MECILVTSKEARVSSYGLPAIYWQEPSELDLVTFKIPTAGDFVEPLPADCIREVYDADGNKDLFKEGLLYRVQKSPDGDGDLKLYANNGSLNWYYYYAGWVKLIPNNLNIAYGSDEYVRLTASELYRMGLGEKIPQKIESLESSEALNIGLLLI